MEEIEISTITCPKTTNLFPDTMLNSIEVLIHHPVMNGSLPDGNFPLVIFDHGNGQFAGLYPVIFDDLASRGFIVANINDANATGSVTRSAYILCALETIVDNNIPPWIGAGRLDGRAALTGHSTGGGGAFRAAVAHFANPGAIETNVVAVAALAPTQLNPDDIDIALGPSAPAFFVLQGSGDGDTSGAAFSNYDRVLYELMGTTIVRAPRKALVWAYDVEHSEYGGRLPPCEATPKGVALATTYFNGFLAGTFYEDPASLALFYGPQPPLVPDSIQIAFPNIQVFATSSERVNSDLGYHGFVIDGFENGISSLSDGGLLVQGSRPGIIQEGDLRIGGLDTTHLAQAAFIRWQDNDEIIWNLDLATRTQIAGATSLSFRTGALDFVSNSVPCTGSGMVAPEEVTLLVSGGGQSTEIDLSGFGRLVVTDVRDELICPEGENQGDGCRAWAVMQTTFRIPLEEICGVLPSDFFLSQIEQLGLRFGGAGGVVLLDDLELRVVPGEPDVTCRCPVDRGR